MSSRHHRPDPVFLTLWLTLASLAAAFLSSSSVGASEVIAWRRDQVAAIED